MKPKEIRKLAAGPVLDKLVRASLASFLLQKHPEDIPLLPCGQLGPSTSLSDMDTIRRATGSTHTMFWSGETPPFRAEVSMGGQNVGVACGKTEPEAVCRALACAFAPASFDERVDKDHRWANR